MKKIRFIFCLATTIFTVECAREELQDEQISEITASGLDWIGEYADDDPETKTTFSMNGETVCWEYGDVFNFYGNSQLLGSGTVTNNKNIEKKAIITQESEFSTTPEFVVHMSETADFSKNTKDDSLTFKISGDQSGLFNDANISAAKVLDGSHTRRFRNLCPIFRMKVTDPEVTTDMTFMFRKCQKLTVLFNLTSFNTRKATNMAYMFDDCYFLNQVFLGKDFVIPDGCFAEAMFWSTSVTVYGTSESMMSFQKALKPGPWEDYEEGCLKFAIDMGDTGWWSAWNSGAEKPTDFGYYYSWGNAEGHWKNGTDDGYVFSNENYQNTTGYTREDDWNRINGWASDLWRVPKVADFNALINCCTPTRTSLNNVYGTEFTHKTNGNWIFFPYAFCSDGNSYTGLSDFSLPETLQSIGSYAFKDMRKKDIYIPASVTDLGSECFGDCGKLETVVMGGNPPSCSGKGPFGSLTLRKLDCIMVPKATIDKYLSDTYFSAYKDIISGY